MAASLGIPKENIFIMSSGDVLEICDEQAKITGRVHTGTILVDGLGVGDVGAISCFATGSIWRKTVSSSWC